MREATVETWQTLFDSAKQVMIKKPWEHFGDMELIGIRPKGFKDIIYVSVMGMDGGLLGLVLYIGEKGLKDFFRTAYCEKLGIPPKYAFYDQTHLACYFMPPHALGETDIAFMAGIDRPLDSGDDIPVFISQKKGYAEDTLDELSVILMREVFKNLLPLFEKPEIKLNCDYGSGAFLNGFYDEEKSCFVYQNAQFQTEMALFERYEILQADWVLALKNRPTIEEKWLIDIDHTPFLTDNPEGGRAIQPRVFVAIDAHTQECVAHEFLSPDTDLMDYLIGFLREAIEAKGKMKSIRVRNAVLMHLLDDFLKQIEVTLEFDPLEEGIETFYADFYESFA